jgi:hypothetical protein
VENGIGIDWLTAIAEDWERVRNGLLNNYCDRAFDSDGINCRYCVFHEDTGSMSRSEPTGEKVCVVHLMDVKMDEALEEERQ